MQGFYVKGDATEAGGTLNIGAAARIHNAQGFWKTNYTTPDNFIRLTISANGYSDETVVRFSPGATDKMDNGLDAYKLFTWDSDVPQIYTVSGNNTDYSINTYNMPDKASVVIPLRTLQTGTNYQISVSEFNFSNIRVFLKDNLNNTTTEIGLNDIIKLSSDDSDKTDRFELIFEKSSSGIVLAENTSVTLYPNPSKGLFYLTVGNKNAEYKVIITNITGQVSYKNKFFGNTSKIIKLAGQSSGIYFVTIKFSDNSSITKKIVIE